MSSLESVTSSAQSQNYDKDFDTLFLNPLIHLIDEPVNLQSDTAMFQKPNANTSELNPFASNFLTSSESMFNINVERPLSQPDNSHDAKKLFVGNLPANTNFNEIMELFKQYGCVNEHLSTVKEDNYAFIHYYSEKDAESAQRSLNNSYFKSRYIRVQYSHSNGHIKKSKTLNFKDISMQRNNGMYQNLQSVQSIPSSASFANHYNHPLSTIPQYSNKFPSSASMYDIPRVQARRPITGGNRKCISKSNMSLNVQRGFDVISSVSSTCNYSTQSLLIPANSQINIYNQIIQLQQMQLAEQNRQFLKKYSNLNEPQNSQKIVQNEFNLFGHGGSSLFEMDKHCEDGNINQSSVTSQNL